MSDFEDALAELDDRAKEGKTASRLIESATETISQLEAQRRDLQGDLSVYQGNEEELKSQLDEARAEIAELKEPRKEIEVDGPVTKYLFSPAGGTPLNNSRREVGLWRLSEIESVLMHLRLAGAGSDLQVRVVDGAVAACVARDDNDLPDGWSWKAPEPVVIVKRRLPWWAWTFVAPVATGLVFTLGLIIG